MEDNIIVCVAKSLVEKSLAGEAIEGSHGDKISTGDEYALL